MVLLIPGGAAEAADERPAGGLLLPGVDGRPLACGTAGDNFCQVDVSAGIPAHDAGRVAIAAVAARPR